MMTLLLSDVIVDNLLAWLHGCTFRCVGVYQLHAVNDITSPRVVSLLSIIEVKTCNYTLYQAGDNNTILSSVTANMVTFLPNNSSDLTMIKTICLV